jgi:hypothetical protein
MVGPEQELRSLIAAAPRDPAGFLKACTRVADWGSLFECAARHGLAGVVRAEAGKAGFPLPAAVARKMDEWTIMGRLQHDWLRAALVEALGALRAGGIRVACLKGPALADRLYDDPALRPSTDIDLLIADVDFDAALKALAPAGWRMDPDLSQRMHRRDRHDVEIPRPHAPTVELHYRAMAGFGTVLPSEDLLSRARPHWLGGIGTLVLCPEDEVIYLALHAAWHLLARLSWLYDLKLLLMREPGLEWATVWERARALRVTAALAFALQPVWEIGGPVPELPRGLSPARAWLTERVRRSVLGRPGLPFLRTGFQTLLCDSSSAAAGFLAVGLWRMARRRTQRYLPWLVPEEWSA